MLSEVRHDLEGGRSGSYLFDRTGHCCQARLSIHRMVQKTLGLNNVDDSHKLKNSDWSETSYRFDHYDSHGSVICFDI